ncbi:MAG: Ni,Fe-hydrogenase maturation factor [Firmicutes bacterium HGW-Firmicutes-14]|nr:MAG: Ni,Fe-hydrogenase maturation factor [Firmicutes bacterium HGW-Firmicutes-14]
MTTGSGRVTVIGAGNDLLKDEGIGVHVVKTMEGLKLPEDVVLVIGGVSGIDMLEHFESSDRVIIVDAVDAGDTPGAVYRFGPEQVGVLVDEHKTSLHQVDLFDTIKMARFLGHCPETVIIGVQPHDISWGTEPTTVLVSRIPEIIQVVMGEIGVLESSDQC